MPKKLKIPYYAKIAARKGLQERKDNQAGLTPKQARMMGITSGVDRARQILRNKSLSEKNLKAIARFYLRFRGRRTKRTETAIKLWGGRRFGRILARIYYKK